jgi:hypothetical protein
MLGVGEHADVLAHLFGLGIGALAGVATAVLVQRRLAALGQIVGALLALGAVATAWALAFTRS